MNNFHSLHFSQFVSEHRAERTKSEKRSRSKVEQAQNAIFDLVEERKIYKFGPYSALKRPK